MTVAIGAALMLPNLLPAKDIVKPGAIISSLEASPQNVEPLTFRNLLTNASSAAENPPKKWTIDRRTKTAVDPGPVKQAATQKEPAKPPRTREAAKGPVVTSNAAPVEPAPTLQQQRKEPHGLSAVSTTIESAQGTALKDVNAVAPSNSEPHLATESIPSLKLNVSNIETTAQANTPVAPPAAIAARKTGHVQAIEARLSANAGDRKWKAAADRSQPAAVIAISSPAAAARREMSGEAPERAASVAPGSITPVPSWSSGLDSEPEASAPSHQVKSVTHDQQRVPDNPAFHAEQPADAPNSRVPDPRVPIAQPAPSQTAGIPAEIAFEARLRPVVSQMAVASVPASPRSRPAASTPAAANTLGPAVPSEGTPSARQTEPQIESERQPQPKHAVESHGVTKASASPSSPQEEPAKPVGPEAGGDVKRYATHTGQGSTREAATRENVQNREASPAVQPAFNSAVSADAIQPALPARTTPVTPQTTPEGVATAATEPTHITSAPPTPAPTGINIALNENGQRVELRVTERLGDIHVAVRTPDSQLATAMREQLPSLSSKLDQAGFHSEMWRPGASTAEHKIADSASGGASSDSRQSSGERDQKDGQQQQGHPRQQGQTRKTDRKEFSWLLDSIR